MVFKTVVTEVALGGAVRSISDSWVSLHVDYCCTLEKQVRTRDDNDITGKFLTFKTSLFCGRLDTSY